MNTYLQNLDQNALGMLLWNNVPMHSGIDRDELVRLVRKTKAPIQLMKAPKPAHVFRRATDSLEEKKWTDSNGNVFSFMVKDLGYHKEKVQRIIVGSVKVEKTNVTFNLANISFNKNRNTVEFDITGNHGDLVVAKANKMHAQVLKFMQDNINIIHSLQVRDFIREAIEGPLNGILVRPGGGVYFIPRESCKKLSALVEVTDHIQDVTVHPVPLVDDDTQRAMLLSTFLDQYRKSMDEVTSLLDLYTTQVPSAKKLTELELQIKALLKISKVYLVDILGKNDSCLDVFQIALDKLNNLWNLEK